jgi:hypothetical protein
MKPDQIITIFIAKASHNKKVEFSHISLFLAIYYRWQSLGFDHPIKITRKKLMTLSKIRSNATYHKCIRELVEMDFIKYEPSYNPTGSLIHWTKTLFSN